MSKANGRVVPVAIYARVSTRGQTPRAQLRELRRYCAARGWQGGDYIDVGESGAKDRRPALDRLMGDARRGRLRAVVCTKLDRLARSVRHLVNLAAELEARGIGLVVVDQELDTTTPSGRLLFHVLAAIAEFERDLIRERVRAGVRAKRARGFRWGRPRRAWPVDRLEGARRLLRDGMSRRAVARELKVPETSLRRALQ